MIDVEPHNRKDRYRTSLSKSSMSNLTIVRSVLNLVIETFDVTITIIDQIDVIMYLYNGKIMKFLSLHFLLFLLKKKCINHFFYIKGFHRCGRQDTIQFAKKLYI